LLEWQETVLYHTSFHVVSHSCGVCLERSKNYHWGRGTQREQNEPRFWLSEIIYIESEGVIKQARIKREWKRVAFELAHKTATTTT